MLEIDGVMYEDMEDFYIKNEIYEALEFDDDKAEESES